MLSKLKFPGATFFFTVAGEEQGLNGSMHFAKMAKDEGWEVEAALNNDIVGGGVVWTPTTVDPTTNTLYFGTGSASPLYFQSSAPARTRARTR